MFFISWFCNLSLFCGDLNLRCILFSYLNSTYTNPDYGCCNNPFYFGADTRSAGCYFYDYAKNFNFIPIQNRKNLSFPVTAKLFTLSAIESRAAKRLQMHLESLRRLCNCAVPICATTFSVPNRILERPTKLSKNNPHSLRFLEDIGGLSWLCRADEILGSIVDEAEAL